MTGITKTTEYKAFFTEVKARIQTAQIKAAIKVNVELLRLHWDLAQLIVRKQKQSTWGDGLISAISKDLKLEFPGMKGFSPTNLKYMRNWYLFYANENLPQRMGKIQAPVNRPQLVDDLQENDVTPVISAIFRIPWGHNREIITKCNTVEEALFYANRTIEHNWSRAVLVHQIEFRLIHREGKALSNFKAKLPQPQSEVDNPTIGILICKSKNNTVVEYALNRVDSPIGVSEYTITKNLPDELKSSLPTIEEIEAELEEVRE